MLEEAYGCKYCLKGKKFTAKTTVCADCDAGQYQISDTHTLTSCTPCTSCAAGRKQTTQCSTIPAKAGVVDLRQLRLTTTIKMFPTVASIPGIDTRRKKAQLELRHVPFTSLIRCSDTNINEQSDGGEDFKNLLFGGMSS